MALQYKTKSLVRFEKLTEERILKELFKLRGIDNMQEFLNLGEHNVHNGMLFKNIQKREKFISLQKVIIIKILIKTRLKNHK